MIFKSSHGKETVNQIVFQSKRSQATRVGVFSYACITLTLTQWPWYSTLTLRRCTCALITKFQGQVKVSKS